ncbi:MAG: type III pantothenate kinase [Alphaproteobacteria bacterium]
MLLAIDIGNTNIVFAVFNGEALLQSFRVETHANDYANAADVLGRFDISRAVIASVVPEVNARVAGGCREAFDVEPVFIDKDNVGIEVAVDNPAEVGADRLVNAAAVCTEYHGHIASGAIVIDFGTATTFDVINGDGAYAGGVIAPGVNLSVAALEAAAAKLPEIVVARPERVIGANTVHAMQSGVFFGYQGLVENIVRRIAGEMGAGEGVPYVIATGGLAPLFATDCDVIDHVDQDLTLKGLRMIAANIKE